MCDRRVESGGDDRAERPVADGCVDLSDRGRLAVGLDQGRAHGGQYAARAAPAEGDVLQRAAGRPRRRITDVGLDLDGRAAEQRSLRPSAPG